MKKEDLKKLQSDRSCKAIQNFGEQHPLFNSKEMQEYRAADKQKFIDEVIAALVEWDKLDDARRFYEGERWHAVNVKRYNDGLDRDELLEIAREVSPKNEVIAHMLAEKLSGQIEDDRGSGIYSEFLREAWDQINYEVTDMEALGARKKDFKFIADTYARGKRILSLGRMGGWACFKMTTDKNAEEIRDILNDILNAENQIIEKDEETLGNKLDDVRGLFNDLREGMEEIADIKAHIKKFNDGLNFSEEVKGRMEEIADELETAENRANACEIFDTGEAGPIDRYTVIYKNDAYGMSLNAKSPQGFNQYLGVASKLSREALGTPVRFTDLCEEVKTAILERLKN